MDEDIYHQILFKRMNVLVVVTTSTASEIAKILGPKAISVAPMPINQKRRAPQELTWLETPPPFTVTDTPLSDIEQKALDIILDKFSYDQVFLTPVLRELSKQLNTSREETKGLIDSLKQRGIISLGKLQDANAENDHGYTAFIINEAHPLVAEEPEA